MPKHPITPFRLTPDERAILDQIAETKNVSRKAVVAEALHLLAKKLGKKLNSAAKKT